MAAGLWTGKLYDFGNGQYADPVVLVDANQNPLLVQAPNGTIARTTALPISASALLGDDGTNLQLVSLSTAAADGVANALNRLREISFPTLFNETTWDRQRNNVEGTALASAARTAQTASADLVNYNGRGIAAFLNVTAASGTGGLQLRIQYKDPASGSYGSLNSLPTAVIATGIGMYAVLAGITGGSPQSSSTVLPRTWRVLVQVGDASSYTYSVGYSLLN